MSDRYIPEYRVVDVDGCFEPQMKYLVRGLEHWYALLPNGYIADPDVWSVSASGKTGASTVRSTMPTRAEADAAINKAMRINEQWELKAVK